MTKLSLLFALVTVHLTVSASAAPADLPPALTRISLRNPQMVAAIQGKAPNAKILLVSNWHFFDKGDGGSRRRVDTINAVLKAFADGKKVRLLEISERMVKPDRELELKFYASDKLHLSGEGYRVWAEAMDPVLAEMMK